MDILEALLPSNEELRDALLKYMVENEMGTAELSRALGISYNTIKFFLNGDCAPRFKTAVRIARFLDIPIGEDIKKK